MAGPRVRFGIALALGAIAYRALLAGAGSGTSEVSLGSDELFFGSHQLNPWLVLPLAAWLFWRRLPAYQALPERRTPLALLGPLLGAALIVQGRLGGAPDLEIPSLSLVVLGVAGHQRGLPGMRAVALPALLLLVGIPLPGPLANETFWWLQVLTTWSSVTLLWALGYDAVGSGIVIRLEDQLFQVIEACSGLRGLQILVLVAVLVRELFHYAGPRMLWVLACAPPIAFAANTVRVAVIAVMTPELAPGTPAEQDHATQGLAVVMGGTLVLYLLGRILERHSALPQEDPPRPALPAPGAWELGCLALLAALSFVPTSERPDAALTRPFAFPLEAPGWQGEPQRPDRLYMGNLPVANIVGWRFRQSARPDAPPVDVFVTYKDPRRARDSLLASKLTVPGREWSPNGSEPRRLWSIDRDVERVLAARPGEQAISYVWHSSDEGVLEASLRSLLALPRDPSGDAPHVVRISTSLTRVGPVARDHADQRLDAFAKAFRETLSQL